MRERWSTLQRSPVADRLSASLICLSRLYNVLYKFFSLVQSFITSLGWPLNREAILPQLHLFDCVGRRLVVQFLHHSDALLAAHNLK